MRRLAKLGGMLLGLLIFCLIISPVGVLANGLPQLGAVEPVVSGENLEFVLVVTGDVAPKLVQYTNPSKVILELPGLALQPGIILPQLDHPAVQSVRLSRDSHGVKLAIDLRYAVPRAQVVRESAERLRLVIPIVFEEATTARVAPGVYYTQLTRGTPAGPLEINVLRIDPVVSQVQVETRLANNRTLGRAPLSKIAAEAGALAAINGSFFGSDGTPLGLFIQDGRLVTEPIFDRTAVAITGSGEILITQFNFSGAVTLGPYELPISGLNRQRYTNELILYTPDRGESTRTNNFGRELVIIDGVVAAIYDGDAPIPEHGYVLSGHGVFKELFSAIDIGTPCAVHLTTDPDWRELDIRFALGAGPLLVADGQVRITAVAERFQSDVVNGRAPRTAFGVTKDGKLIAVTVNGRLEGISMGMTLEELAELMIDLGCEQALNLDGGGSATMVIRNRPLNMPSDGKERQVASGIVFKVNLDKGSF